MDNPFHSIRKEVIPISGAFPARRIIQPILCAAMLMLAGGCTGFSGGKFPLVVNSTGDERDLIPGNNQCRVSLTSNECTLRAALEEANALRGTQTITFNIPGKDQTIYVTKELPKITENVVLDGTTQPGYDGGKPLITINGEQTGMPGSKGPAHGIIIGVNVDATMKAVRITRFALNGMESAGNLLLDRMEIARNEKNGIHSSQSPAIRSDVISNSAVAENGESGISGDATNFTITGVSILGNARGGIRVSNGSLNLTQSTVQNNTTPTEGGGIVFTEGGVLTITDSTIRGNQAMAGGALAGGIAMDGDAAALTNTLITENHGWISGGIYIRRGNVRLTKCTLTKNLGWDAGGVYVADSTEASLIVEAGSQIGKVGEGNTAAILSEGGKFGGGIFTQSSVSISDSTIEGNNGAGIQSIFTRSRGPVRLSRSSVQNNTLAGISAANTNLSLTEGTVRQNSGGGISMDRGRLVISKSKVVDNQNSGGIVMQGGIMEITGSTVAGNRNSGTGGGISGTLLTSAEISTSTISGNFSTANGGGLYLSASPGSIQLLNTTISGNRSNATGGGLATGGGEIRLINVTLARNTAKNAGGIYNSAALSLNNTLVAENAGGNCLVAVFINTRGHNLDSDGSCNLNSTGDLSGISAGIDTLFDNGGPTQTHALLPGSAAIDGGDDSTCPAADQRGLVRPSGPHCDIGAYEAIYLPPVTIATPITRTPTPTPQPVTFDPVNFSSLTVSADPACGLTELTIEVGVIPVALVESVGLFLRLEEKNSGNVTSWSPGLAMIPVGKGFWQLTLSAANLSYPIQWKSDAWLAVQFVAYGKGNALLGRSAVIRQVTVLRCPSAQGTPGPEETPGPR
jgi:CSLREA domain-containing protein